MAVSVIAQLLAKIDAKIAALQLARAEILEQQQPPRKPRTPPSGDD